MISFTFMVVLRGSMPPTVTGQPAAGGHVPAIAKDGRRAYPTIPPESPMSDIRIVPFRPEHAEAWRTTSEGGDRGY